MTPKRIILVRHGESEANVDHEVYAKVPDWKIALTNAGVEQACEAGRKIAGLIGGESFGVFSSPYLRTLQTKEAMLEGMGRAPVFDYQDPSLREQEYGNTPPRDVNYARHRARKEFGMFFYRFAEGESCADVYDRMAIFMNTLFRRFEREDCPDNIILVSHGLAIKCFLARWYHWDVGRFDVMEQLPNCHISLMLNSCSGQMSRDNDFVLTEPYTERKIYE